MIVFHVFMVFSRASFLFTSWLRNQYQYLSIQYQERNHVTQNPWWKWQAKPLERNLFSFLLSFFFFFFWHFLPKKLPFDFIWREFGTNLNSFNMGKIKKTNKNPKHKYQLVFLTDLDLIFQLKTLTIKVVSKARVS